MRKGATAWSRCLVPAGAMHVVAAQRPACAHTSSDEQELAAGEQPQRLQHACDLPGLPRLVRHVGKTPGHLQPVWLRASSGHAACAQGLLAPLPFLHVCSLPWIKRVGVALLHTAALRSKSLCRSVPVCWVKELEAGGHQRLTPTWPATATTTSPFRHAWPSQRMHPMVPGSWRSRRSLLNGRRTSRQARALESWGRVASMCMVCCQLMGVKFTACRCRR